VTAYVALAIAVAVLGTLTDSRRLVAMATVALVVFTTFQSFAVFAQVIQGAWLFVVLGLVFATTGLGFDRARRELVANLDDDNRTTDQPEENR
jgi:K+ transporter